MRTIWIVNMIMEKVEIPDICYLIKVAKNDLTTAVFRVKFTRTNVAAYFVGH